MNREYLEDYGRKEDDEHERLFVKRIENGTFVFGKDKYPPDYRFVKLKRPVAYAFHRTVGAGRLWAMIPFSGSVIITIPPIAKEAFESVYFNVSEIPRILDFIKETGCLQIALSHSASLYAGLDYLDPIFQELRPPEYRGPRYDILYGPKEMITAEETFETLAAIRFSDLFKQVGLEWGSTAVAAMLKQCYDTYTFLKAGRFAVVEDIENLITDDPAKAYMLLYVYRIFILIPFADMRSDSLSYSLEQTRMAEDLPLVYRPEKLRFPYEIGSFLLQKLTYASTGIDACKEIMYHYSKYDLRKLLESLNEAIVANKSSIVTKNAGEISEVLDNVWNDKTIPRRVKGLQIGMPLSMAAIGSVAAGPIGAAGGFLAGLGFDVASTLIDLGTEGLSERLAKLKTRSYQANIYDFKEKYKGKITE